MVVQEAVRAEGNAEIPSSQKRPCPAGEGPGRRDVTDRSWELEASRGAQGDTAVPRVLPKVGQRVRQKTWILLVVSQQYLPPSKATWRAFD